MKQTQAKKKVRRKYTEEKTLSIKEKLERYIEDTPIPIIAEFAYKNHIPREQLYRLPELNHTIKELIDKKEAQLERLGLTGVIDKAMAIFSLKQLGWKDKTEVEHSGSVTTFNLIKPKEPNGN